MSMIVICMPLPLFKGRPAPGSTVELCAECRTTIWVSPVSKANGTRFVCTMCALTDVEVSATPMPGQVEELRQAMKEAP